MAYNNIYDWHDSVRKYLEKEIEKDRRETISGWMDRVGGDEQHRFFTGRLNSGGKPEGQKRVNRNGYSQEFVDRYQKWGQDHREELKTIWGVPRGQGREAWERQSKIEPDLRNIWGTPGQTYTSCGQPKKRDPNDITDLCKVRVE